MHTNIFLIVNVVQMTMEYKWYILVFFTICAGKLSTHAITGTFFVSGCFVKTSTYKASCYDLTDSKAIMKYLCISYIMPYAKKRITTICAISAYHH
jgi:hypothetical protein